MILGRLFLSTIHARIDVFDKEILLGARDDRIIFYMNSNVYHPVVLVENACMINELQGEESFNPFEIGKEYKLAFDMDIEQLVDEYELGIGKKGYVLDDIWEKYEQVHGGTMYSWLDEGFKEEER
ncbi:hypothetical protein Tco_1005391 [Tanacetum coccineum]|uniref:Uncharacterized protein n=1 Tax=Tanacetum coccineum TaxID=301880 RepID=A0ABQ5FF34_9ASTR